MDGNQMSLSFENHLFNRRSALGGAARMGCTLVTGFLGSGKTTLLRHLLSHRLDLRLALLAHEFADSDLDSRFLDSHRINQSFLFQSLPLTHGQDCSCCDVSGPLRESLRRVVESRHNFDCLIIETSGLASPEMFVAELEQVGIHLDLTVAVVDAESFDKIVDIDVVRKQLQHVDIVLLNKCDLASLSQISDAEDTLHGLTKGAKVVRSQFCRVPLDLVIDCGKLQALAMQTEACNIPAVLSHESVPKSPFLRNKFTSTSEPASFNSATEDKIPAEMEKKISDDSEAGSSKRAFSSISFESEVPLSLSSFQSHVLKEMRNSSGLLRAKGILWFAEDRESRFVFHWSGLKRVEAISEQPWESSPRSCIVLIGTDKSELGTIHSMLSESASPHLRVSSYGEICREYAKRFATKIEADGRFKEPSLVKEPIVVFSLKGSPLRGVKESHLNGALMRLTNNKGNFFLMTSFCGEENNLQLLMDERFTVDEAWNEIRSAASIVISKLCKNFCPCRSDLSAHVH